MSLELLRKSLLDAKIIKKGGYDYIIHPLTDGIPEIHPELLSEVVDEFKKNIEKLGHIDKIVTIEAMGIPIATLLSYKLNIPFTIIRKRSYGFDNEIKVKQTTGYSNGNLWVNGIKKGDRVLVIDDILSTGGTLKAVLDAMNKMNINVKGVFVIINKGKDLSEMKEKYNFNIQTMLNIEIINDDLIIKT